MNKNISRSGAPSVEGYLTDSQLSQIYGLSVSFFKRARKFHSMPHYKFGKTVRMRKSEIERWFEQHRKAV